MSTKVRPSNPKLPDWLVCHERVANGTATALERFIEANEPADEFDTQDFRQQLTDVLAEANSQIERLRAALVRARPCVKESLTHWDQLLLEQEKAPRSNAPHMLPDHYIGTLRQQVKDLRALLDEIDEAAPPAESCTCGNGSVPGPAHHPTCRAYFEPARPDETKAAQR
jgi:hypothetical protein